MNASDLLHALHTPEEDAADSALPQFPGYTVISQLGRGGSGRVYLARREGSEALVALKHLEHHHSPNDVQRAWRELELLSQLRADCLPRVLDYGHRDGRIFIVTEYIEGLSLTAHCQARKLDRRARAALLVEVAEAVQTLHDHGIIHRDIKPSNVIVDVHGKPIIIDLGIAVLLAHDVMQTLTAEGAPLGSPAFMSPEQARGERSRISIRSDVYSLGATAYLLLTGQTPHDCDVTLHEAVRRVAQEPGRAPRSLDPTIPKPLEAVLQKTTAFEPEKRYTTAHAFAEDLHRWLEREPVTARRAGPPTRATRWMRKHPIYTTTIACAMIALIILGVALATTWQLSVRPARIEISEDEREVRLLARNGSIIHIWSAADQPGKVRFAQFVRGDQTPNGSPAVIIGWRHSRESSYSHSVCQFPLSGNRDEPTWLRRVSLAQAPLHREETPQGTTDTEPARLMVRDVFPGRVATEIIVSFLDEASSLSALCIYSMDGELLYRTWHHGEVIPGYWLEVTKRLVGTAPNTEAYWDERSDAEVALAHPYIVFAVEPRIGQIDNGWALPDLEPSDRTLCWYRCLLPPEATDRVAFPHLAPPESAYDPRQYFRVQLNILGSAFPVGVTLLVDADGNEVPGCRQISDGVKRMNDPPPYDEYYLGQLPLIESDGKGSR